MVFGQSFVAGLSAVLLFGPPPAETVPDATPSYQEVTAAESEAKPGDRCRIEAEVEGQIDKLTEGEIHLIIDVTGKEATAIAAKVPYVARLFKNAGSDSIQRQAVIKLPKTKVRSLTVADAQQKTSASEPCASCPAPSAAGQTLPLLSGLFVDSGTVDCNHQCPAGADCHTKTAAAPERAGRATVTPATPYYTPINPPPGYSSTRPTYPPPSTSVYSSPYRPHTPTTEYRVSPRRVPSTPASPPSVSNEWIRTHLARIEARAAENAEEREELLSELLESRIQQARLEAQIEAAREREELVQQVYKTKLEVVQHEAMLSLIKTHPDLLKSVAHKQKHQPVDKSSIALAQELKRSRAEINELRQHVALLTRQIEALTRSAAPTPAPRY